MGTETLRKHHHLSPARDNFHLAMRVEITVAKKIDLDIKSHSFIAVVA